MPLNESSGNYRKGRGLTKQQRKEQEAALYGLHPTNAMEDFFAAMQSLTPEEQARLMAVIRPSKPGQVKVHDLNNPPKEPYIFEPYPKMLYRFGDTRIVQTQEEHERAAAEGWKDKGLIGVAEEPEALDEQSAVEAANIDDQIRKKRR